MLICVVALLMVAPVLRALDISQCIAPLGMESFHIPDKDISASSCYNDGNVAPQNGRLNQDIKGGAWCPRSVITTDSAEWLEVDLHAVHVITAAGTQGRFGNGQGQEFAEHYAIDYWRPRLGKWLRYRTNDDQEILTGNTNTYLEKKNTLQPPIWASRVRFIPYSSHRRTVCLRAELYGCYWNGGIVSYSMTKGDKRSNGVELTDVTYDGQWGEELRGGLGQLVDGVFGGDEIREAARQPVWVGWRNDSRSTPPVITFEFDRVREFSAVHIYCNNKFMRDVQVFSEAIISFSIGGRHYQEEPVRYSTQQDSIFEQSRNVSVKLHHRIGRWVRIELHFSARWILISEVVFDSDVAQGNHTPESQKPATSDEKTPQPAKEAPITTARPEDPLYVAIVVGVLTALVILLAVAVFLIVHRHRHKKCFASPVAKTAVSQKRSLESYSGCGTSMAENKGALECPDVKSDEYQEPYQAVKCAPYLGYSTVLLEMKDLTKDSLAAPYEDSSNYDYAVPELSCAPLLKRRFAEGAGELRLEARYSVGSMRKRILPTPAQQKAIDDLNTRLKVSDVVEFPRHRLRMITKLAEGGFGTVYIAEADCVPEYGGLVTGERRYLAVKFLNPDATLSEREDFLRDVRLLAALTSPYLARVVGACRTPPLAVVLEYLRPGDLFAYLRAAPPPPPDALLAIADQVAAGMKYLESLNFVHRDLAARNCLVGEGYQVKISDFNTDNEAYAAEYRRSAGFVPLPLRWAAWESALRGRYTTKSDVWAFAVTLYEVYTLCRRRPYEELSDDEVLENLATMEIEPSLFECLPRSSGMPRDIYELMRECWRCEEAARPAFAEIHAFLQSRVHYAS